MSLRFPELPEGVHVRTCQECDHRQIAKDPDTMKSDSWRDLKCRKCKSEAMDFGTVNNELEDE